MAAIKNLLAWTLKLAGYTLAATLVLGVVMIVTAGFTATGSSFMTSWIASLASGPGRTVTITDMGPILTGRLRIGSVVVADEQGPYAQVQGLEVDWSPLSLLTATFKADRIAAAQVEFSRTPIIPPQPETSSEPFQLPVKLDIASISLPSVVIGQPVMGQALSLAAEGSARADANVIDGRISARRTDSPDTTLQAELSYAPADNRLALNGSYAEPQSGILGGLLRLPSNPAIAIDIDGTGPLNDWRGELTAALNGERVANVTATHRQPQAGERHIGISGGGQFASLLPPTLRAAFGGETSVELSASIMGEDRLVIDTASLTTGDLLLTASGQLDRNGENDLQANLIGVGSPIEIRWPLAAGELAASVNGIDFEASGPGSSVTLNLRASVASLTTPDLALEGVRLVASSTDFNLATRSGSLLTELTLDRSKFNDPNIDRVIMAPATIRAPLVLSPEAIAFNQATIESASIGGTLSGRYDLTTGTAEVDTRLFAAPAVFPQALAEKLTETVELAGRLSYAGADDIAVEGLQVRSNLATITGDAGLANGSVSAQLQGTIATLASLMPNAQGTASFSLDASGPLDGIAGKADITIPEANMAGRKLTGFEISVDGGMQDGGPRATISGTGSIDGQPIDIASSLAAAEGGRIEIPDIAVTIGANRLTGQLALSPDFKPSGTVDFDLPAIDLIAALAGQQVSGDLKGQVTLAETAQSFSVAVAASGGAIRRDDLQIVAPNINVSIADVSTFAADGTITASRVSSGANVLEGLRTTIRHTGSETVFDATGRYDNAPMRVAGTVRQTANGMAIALANANATPRGVEVRLAAPTTITIENGRVSLGTIDLRAGGGNVRVTGTVADRLAVDARIEQLPASLANAFVSGLGATGTISGTVKATGTTAAPVVDYNLNWGGAAVQATQSLGIANLTIGANGRFAGQTLTLNTTVGGVSGLSIAGGGTVGISGNQPLALNFNGNVPIALFEGLLAAQGFVVEGSANADIRITGPATAPVINGQISLSGGRLIDVRRNLTIEGLTASIAAQGDRVTISNVSGRLSGGGTITGSGTIDIRAPGLPADITLRLNDAQYADGMMFTTSASGELTLRGPLTAGPTLAGAITLTETAITVPERLPTTIRELDIKHRNAPAVVREQLAKVERRESNGNSSDIALDLSVRAPNRIFVRGRGIDAELGGAVTIRGTASAPQVSGAFTLNRGRLSILTKRLNFTSGTITFGGNLIPLLNLEATSSSGSTTITITVSGLANDPEVSFSSAPALPQDEILAQLIFGQSMSKLSALQIAQLADAASQLAGGRSSSLFETLRSGLGVDNLDISTDAEGNTAVSAGKYLNERTYIELQQSGDGGGKAVINLDVGRGVKLRGEAGGDGSSGAGIFYEREY